MGSGSSVFTEEELQVYKELTYLTQAEILRVYKKFQNLDPKTRDMKRTRIPLKRLKKLPELKENPFRDRLGAIFSSEKDGQFSFEDLLDMMSILSPQAPVERKAYYAFRMYDLDGDNQISREDLQNVIEMLSRAPKGIESSRSKRTDDNKSNTVLSSREINDLVENILREADIDNDGVLSFQEFEHMILKTPDFASSFTIRL